VSASIGRWTQSSEHETAKLCRTKVVWLKVTLNFK